MPIPFSSKTSLTVESVRSALLNSMQFSCTDGAMTLTIPQFFVSGNPLVLTVFRTKDTFVFHDNGCALRELSAVLPDDSAVITLANRFCLESPYTIQQHTLMQSTCTLAAFPDFLRAVAFLANADLATDCLPDCEKMDSVEPILPSPVSAIAEEWIPEIQNLLCVFAPEPDEFHLGFGLLIPPGSAHVLYRLVLENGCPLALRDVSRTCPENSLVAQHFRTADTSCTALCRLLARFGGTMEEGRLSLRFTSQAFPVAFWRFVQLTALAFGLNPHKPVLHVELPWEDSL